MPPVLATLALLAPASLLVASLRSGRLAAPALGPSRRATVLALVLALAAAVLTAGLGPVTSPLLGAAGVGLSVRLDAISCSMFLLVAFVGVIVVQYSRNYMDGDTRQGEFLGGLCRTLAAVMLLVLAGNLAQLVAAWAATSLSLHGMLVFYRERRAARIAARKKFIAARLGDLCLVGAAVAMVHAFGSTDIATILARAHDLPAHAATATWAAALLGIAALMKSAQFPAHGWLPEVMDTPTPVSALLHAGIINAGGFLLIRFADVMLLSMTSLHLIALVGGFTALLGGVVMLTQTTVKGALAWSTVAQMGFMTLQCGLGAFAIALLHLLAHSLYKAHAFLSSGSVIETSTLPVRNRPRLRSAAISLVLALAIYVAAGWLSGAFARPQAAVLTLGAILVMGTSLLLAPSWQGAPDARLVIRTLLLATVITVAYFALETAAIRLTAATLPPIPVPDTAGRWVMGLAIASFAAVSLLQSLAPRWMHRPTWRIARVHLANGLYVNAWANRLVGALRRSEPAHPTSVA
ncbi:proton-conducting transporter membrane subunit [Frateuria soli]|uniref:proton-conducting transporter transmembrane domain-containing protein n=1 Tax=Frateuria soli TaxID=1542730 RepID=UPI001E345C51|nr:proton-conducting transporter membrane subunit [Frateuria soli]UGB39545.1 oxidoreductase [Frateuria soli]